MSDTIILGSVLIVIATAALAFTINLQMKLNNNPVTPEQNIIVKTPQWDHRSYRDYYNPYLRRPLLNYSRDIRHHGMWL